MTRARFHDDLKPYAILMAGIGADMDNLTEYEVIDLRNACEGPTRTNCWYMTMRAAEFLKPLLDDQILRRKLKWPTDT